jgi:hypothetical protein
VTVTTRVRHLIVLNTGAMAPAIFQFQSRDVGFTQGTTISYGETVVAQYKPGTRHWSTALDLAEQVLAKAMERVVSSVGGWHLDEFTEAVTAVLAEEKCQPWGGKDPVSEESW